MLLEIRGGGILTGKKTLWNKKKRGSNWGTKKNARAFSVEKPRRGKRGLNHSGRRDSVKESRALDSFLPKRTQKISEKGETAKGTKKQMRSEVLDAGTASRRKKKGGELVLTSSERGGQREM